MPARAEGERGEQGDTKRYERALARVRLARAWVAVAAAVAAMLLPYVALLERVVKK